MKLLLSNKTSVLSFLLVFCIYMRMIISDKQIISDKKMYQTFFLHFSYYMDFFAPFINILFFTGDNKKHNIIIHLYYTKMKMALTSITIRQFV